MTRLSAVRRALLLGALALLGRRRRRLVAWRALSGLDVRDLTFERDGLVWTVAPDDEPVGFELFTEGAYHAPQLDALLAWAARAGVLSDARDVVLDVGAHIGSTCIPLVRAAGCRALAIEPVAENFRRLGLNVTANGLADRILLARTAVLRAPGRVLMRLTAGASGSHFVWREGATAAAAGGVADLETVDASPLTAVVESAGLSLGQIGLVWADVQGCEAEVIESGAPLWAQGVPLWAEVEPSSLAMQAGVAAFERVARAHFDRFIPSKELIRLGAAARPVPIAGLGALLRGITPEQLNTDVLLLPPACCA